MENLALPVPPRADPTVIYPMIQKSPPEFNLSNENFDDLEKLGQIKLSAELRLQLGDLAQFWVGQLAVLRSPRPKQFRNHLQLIGETIAAAHDAALRAALRARRSSRSKGKFARRK